MLVKRRFGGSQVPPPPPEKKVTVSTFAGDGTAAYLDGPLLSARFSTPSDVAISADGILYVADYNSRRIRMIKDGQVFLLAGDGHFGTRNGDGDTAQFVDLSGLRQMPTAMYMSWTRPTPESAG